MADNPRYAPFPPVDPFAFFRSIPAFILAFLLFFPIGLLLSLPFGGLDAKPPGGIVLLIAGVALLPFLLWMTVVFVAWPRFLVPPMPAARRTWGSRATYTTIPSWRWVWSWSSV